ncbi:MAG TPA: hypothetical protein VF092_18525 [Longimicrobium sp.]
MPRTRPRLAAIAALGALLAAAPAAAQVSPAPPGRPAMLRIEEEPQSGGTRALPTSGRGFADINSVLRVVPDQAAIEALAAPALRALDDPAARRVAALSDTLGQVRDLLRAFDDSLSAVVDAISAAEAQLARNPRDAAAHQALRASLAGHAGILIPLITFLADRGANTDSALAVGDPGYVAIGELARREIEGIGQRLAGASSDLARSRPDVMPRVQIFAVRTGPDRPASQIHISNYDNLPQGDVTPVDKLAFTMTPEEQARVERGRQFAREILQLAGDLRTTAARLREDVETAARLLSAELDSAKVVLDSLPTAAELRALRDELAALPQTAQLRYDLDAVASLVEPLATLRTLHQSLRGGVQGGSAEALLAQLAAMQQSLSQVMNALPAISALPGRLAEDLDALDTAVRAVLAGDAGAQRTRLQRLLEQQIPRWKRAQAQLSSLGQHYRTFAARVTSLSELAGLTGATERVGSTSVPLDQIERTLVSVQAASLVPGELYLRRNVADGDEVTITLRVLDPQTGKPLAQEERTVGVRTFGLYRTWTAGLAFASPQGASGFKPGISTSYVLHFRNRPGGRANPGSLLDPRGLGVGLMSVVFTRDDGIQLGIGGTLTLLEDIVQAGYGVNLQTEKGYFVLATPLLDLINRARDAIDR